MQNFDSYKFSYIWFIYKKEQEIQLHFNGKFSTGNRIRFFKICFIAPFLCGAFSVERFLLWIKYKKTSIFSIETKKQH